MKAVHFACDLTSLLRHRNPKKKDVYKNVVFVWPPMWLFIMSSTKSVKKCSESKTSSAEVRPEIVPTVT